MLLYCHIRLRRNPANCLKYWQSVDCFEMILTNSNFYLRFNSKDTIWMSCDHLNLVKILDDKEDLIYTKSPPFRLLTFILRGLWKLGIKNCEIRNKGCTLASAIEMMSTMPATNSQRFSYCEYYLCLSKKTLCYLHYLTLKYLSDTPWKMKK